MRQGRPTGTVVVEPDAKTGAPPVFVMSYKMWLKHFNLDSSILGRTFVLNGLPTTLVGSMPPRFTKLGADLWRPVNLNRADAIQKNRYYNFQARLKRGVSVRDAQADIEVIVRRLAQVYPENYPKKLEPPPSEPVPPGAFQTTVPPDAPDVITH